MADRDPRWYRIADHVPKIFYFVLGVGSGAFVAVSTGTAKMQPDVANLLGGILGAGIGAFGAGMISVLLYQKQRIDQIRPKAKELYDRYWPMTIILDWVDRPNRTAGSLDLLDTESKKMLDKGKANEGFEMGARIGGLLNQIRLDLIDIRHRMGTACFDNQEAATMREFTREVRAARATLRDLMPELKDIADSE